MTIVYPREKWNGKMWVMVHGRGRSFKRGNLKPWDKNLDRAKPSGDLTKYETVMLSKGYAVVKTHRTSDTLGGDVKVTGNQAKLEEVVSYLDTFEFWFNIVTP